MPVFAKEMENSTVHTLSGDRQEDAIRYVICSMPRSGGSLLFSLLKNTGIAGRGCGEEFEQRRIDRMDLDWNKKDLGKFIKEILDSGGTPNGVSGFKLHWPHLENLVSAVHRVKRYRGVSVWNATSYFPRMKYIYLVRNDKVRQAVSAIKVSQTGLWRLKKGQEKTSLRVPSFHFWRIFSAVAEFRRQERAWEKFFLKNGISPLKIEYEEYTEDYRSTVVRILDYLGVPPPEQLVIETDLVKQSDSLSEEWVEQYYKRMARGGIIFSGGKIARIIMCHFYPVSAYLKKRYHWYDRFIKKIKNVRSA